MPLTIQLEGKDTVVYLEDDLQKARTEAADAERKRIEDDPDGIAASARRKAEQALRDAKAEAQTLKDERDQLVAKLADATKPPEEVDALRKQLSDVTAKMSDANTQVQQIREEHKRDLQLLDLDVKAARVDRVKRELQADGVDLSDPDAVKAALGTLRTESPGWFREIAAPTAPPGDTSPTTQPPVRNGVTGSPNEGAAPTSQDQYNKAMAEGRVLDAIAIKNAEFGVNKE